MGLGRLNNKGNVVHLAWIAFVIKRGNAAIDIKLTKDVYVAINKKMKYDIYLLMVNSQNYVLANLI